MTPKQHELCQKLVITPPHGLKEISNEEFLRQFPDAIEEGTLSLNLLAEAYRKEDKEDLRCALIIGFTFGFSPQHLDLLSRLVDADWHFSHEDVVSALDRLRSVDAVPALFRATQWIPEYLDYDDHRALAVKAIWGLGNLPGKEAERYLELLKDDEDPILRKNAIEQLQRRAAGS